MRLFRKFLSSFLIFILLFFQGLIYPLVTVYAQEVSPSLVESSSPASTSTESPTPSPTEVPSQEVSPSPEISSSPTETPSDIQATPTPSPEVSPEPTDSPSPTPTPEVSPEITPSPTPSATSPPETPLPSVTVSPSPSLTPAHAKEIPQGHLSIVIEHESTQADLKLDLSQQGQTSASLSTDKADYSPTDVVLVSGTNFTSNTAYTLIISSEDPPAVHFETQVTADNSSNFIYSYQLDGNYRPNYKVEVKDSSGNTVASTTFTDAVRNFSSSISPSSISILQSQQYTFIATNSASSTASVGSMSIILPTGFGTPTIGSRTMTGSSKVWDLSTATGYVNGYNSTSRLIGLVAHSSADQLAAGQTLTVLITTTAPSSVGLLTWTTTPYANLNLSGNTFSGTSPTTTINKGTPTITWSNPASITYGTALSSTQLNATASYLGNSLQGTFSYNPASGTVLNAGTQTLSVNFTPTDTSNYNSTSASVTLNVQKANSTVTVTPVTVNYDGGPHGTSGTVYGINNTAIGSPTISYSGTNYGPTSTPPTNAGTYTAAGTFSGDSNYNSSQGTATITIGTATVDFSLGNTTQTYDGTPKSVTVSTNLSNSVTYNGSLTPPTNAGSYTVVATITDPNFSGSVTGTLTIKKATPFITWSNPADIIYGIALSSTQLSASSAVNGNYIYNPSSGIILNVGNSQTLSVNFTPSDTSNYFDTSAMVAINVLKATPTVTVQYVTTTYDGNQHSTSGTITGVNGADLGMPTISYEGINGTNYGPITTAPAKVGTYKAIGSYGGNDNYESKTGEATITIQQKDLTVSASGTDKVYDGTTSATVSLSTDAIPGDDVTANYTSASFDTKNVDIGKTVSVSGISVSGTDVSNYHLVSDSTSTTANISQASLTVGGITADDKLYDGNDTATLNTDNASINEVPFNTDVVTLNTSSAIGVFADALVGIGKVVTISGLTLNGVDASNYNLTQPTTTANINKANTTTSVTSSKNPALVNDQVTFTAKVSSSSTTPTGTVTFKEGNTVLASNQIVDGSGNAFFSKSDFSLGAHIITATYNGDNNFTQADSSSITQSIVSNLSQVVLTSQTTVSSSTPDVLVTNTGSDSTITIPSGINNATLDMSNLLTAGNVTLNNAITLNSDTSIGTVKIEIPAGITITGTSGWNGVVNAPQVKVNSTVANPSIPGFVSTQVTSVLEIGFGDVALTFDKAVRIKLVGANQSPVGYSRGGVFTEITNICSDNTESGNTANLSAGADCKINVGTDVVIWTKHFTKFVTFSKDDGKHGDGIDRLGCAFHDCSGVQAGNPAPQNLVLGISTLGPAVAFVSGVLGTQAEKLGEEVITQDNNKGEVKGESSAANQKAGEQVFVGGLFGAILRFFGSIFRFIAHLFGG